MLEPLQNKINSLGGNEIYLTWGKYYLKSIDPPRDLFKQYPQFEQFSSLIKYKAMDKNEFKTRIKLINTKEDIEKVLVQAFKLDNQINLPNAFNFLSKAQESLVSRSKNFKPVFCAAMRIFIQINYQLNPIIDGIIRTQNVDYINKLEDIAKFFSQFQDKHFTNFLTIFLPFLNTISTKSPLFFQDTSSPSLKSSFLYLISSFFSLVAIESSSQTSQPNQPSQPSQIITVLIKLICNVTNTYKAQNWDLDFVRALFLIYSQLAANIKSANEQGIELAICSICFIFNILQLCNSVQPYELYKLSIACIQCFQFCIELEKIDNNLVIHQAPNIVFLIQWLVKNYSGDQNSILEKDVLKDLKDPQELGPIGMNNYFAYMDTIQYKSPKLSIELSQILEKIKSLVKLFNDPVSFLNALVTKAFSSDLGQSVESHLYIIFIAELIFRFDERLVGKSFNNNKCWNQLFIPQIFPTKAGVTYDKTLTECCLLIMLRCIMYDDAGTTTNAIFGNIANFAKANGEIVFSYFINLFNSLLVTADQKSSFMIAFAKSSSLLEILISLAQRRLSFFDLIRNLVAKAPNYAFTSNEIDFLICQSFTDPKRSKSSIELIDIGLKLAKTAPESTQALLRVIGVTLTRMFSSKMTQAIDLFNIVAKSDALFQMPLTTVSKLGPTFDAFSFIPIVFPNEYNRILNYFIFISKKSPAIVQALQSNELKIYANFSKAFDSNPNENAINLLFSLATNDTQNIVNSKALEFVLEKAQIMRKEFQIIMKVNEMCERSPENLRKVSVSEVPGFIVSRLSTVFDQQTKNLLFSLYKKICANDFTVTTFYSTITAINKPTFESPQVITDIYASLIKQQKSSTQPGTILSVFTTINVGPNILPLFRRLNGCEKCVNDKGQNYCQNCGALELQDGVKYVSCILYFLTKMLKVSILFNKVFYNLHGPQLLVQFLSQIKSIYLNREIIDRLFKIFKSIQIPELAVSYVESIWMDFDFISQFAEEDHNYFFGKIPDAYELNKQAFYKRTIVERVLFKLMNEKSDSNSYALLSSLLNSLVSGANSKSLLSTFFSILYNNSSPELTDSILNMTYMLIVTKNKTMLDILEEFSYFKPFVPLMAIPNSKIQKLSLQCIMKMPTAKTDSDKLYSTMIQCSVAYNKSDNEEIIFKQLNDSLKSIPNLLPFWATVCRNLSDKKQVDNIFNQLYNDDPYFTQFAEVPLWFYWILTIKKFDQETIRQLIFTEKNELKIKELSLLFDFFEIYQYDTGIDFTAIRTSILQTLIKKTFTNSDASKSDLRIIFYYLFFIKIKPLNAKRFNCLENFLDKKLSLFSQKAKYPSVFHLKVDEKTGKWIDATFANEVLTKVTPESSFYVEFSPTFRIHSYVIFAYIAHILNKFTRKTSVEISALFEPLLQKADIVTAYTVASILVNDWKLPMLDEYLDYYHDEKDSPEFQLFKFEDRISQSASSNSFYQLLNDTIQRAMVVSIPLKEPDNDTSIKAFCSYSDPAIYKPILDNFSEFKQNQNQKILRDKVHRSRLLTNFMTKLQLGCGPWALKTNQINFMMLNSTTPKGNRNLMKIYNLPNSIIELSSKNAKATLYPSKIIDISLLIDGDLSIIKNSLLFEGKDANSTKIDIKISDIAFVFKRQFPSYPTSIEVFSIDNRSFVFALQNANTLDSLLKQIDKISNEIKNDKFMNNKFNIFRSISVANSGCVQKLAAKEIYLKMNLLKLWQKRDISNFEYIYYLNLLLGRSYHVVDQYPIFPAILGNVEAFSLSNPHFFAPFPNYQQVTGDEICSMLCRVIPFNVPFLKVKVKKPLKEISEIKSGFQELYYLPSFLMNENQFTIENVKLPQWSQNNPYKYVSVIRRALETEFVSVNLPKWLDESFGKCFLFATPHQPRNIAGIPRPNPYQNIEGLPAEFSIPVSSVSRIKKQMCICNNGFAYDFRNNKHKTGYVQFRIPPEIHGSVLSISKINSCIVFGQKNEPSITFLCLNSANPTETSTQKFTLIPSQSSSTPILVPAASITTNISSAIQPITCATIIGDRFIVISSDCNLFIYKFKVVLNNNNENFSPAREQYSSRVQSMLTRQPISRINPNTAGSPSVNLPGMPRRAPPISGPSPVSNLATASNLSVSLQFISTTSFHNTQVICIAGNAELGLIASIDKEYNLVIETVFNEIFIRSAPMAAATSNLGSGLSAFIEVFKSGSIIVILAGQTESKIFSYDTRGKLIGGLPIQGRIVETDKICTNFALEYLAVGIENVGIKVFDLTDFREDKKFEIPEFSGKFSTISKTKAIVAEDRGKLVLFKF